MKELLLKVMALFGVVPAPRYRALVRQLEQARQGAQAWKDKAGEALTRVRKLDAEINRQHRLVKEARRAAEKAHPGDRELERLRDQLASTERELMLAREHLMAIEVKLDILEGAANVLDARTRVAIRQSTGAAV